ncbi:MAG: tight adherence protein [Frankiaceae bacterium]|nr:tight adherence protein [Frankiaceae bacterium]
MGASIGLLFGIGALLIWQSASGVPTAPRRGRRTVSERTAELLLRAGYTSVRPHQLFLLCLGTGAVTVALVAVVSHSVSVALSFGALAGYAPVALVKHRRRRRVIELRDLWPDVVDNLASAVRAGLSLPEAVTQIASRGPEPLRPPFRRFGENYRATGRFGECLDRLKSELSDPVADRLVESLRVAREVGGSDLGRLLRTLSQFLREDARTRAELETRQGWTVNAARLALAAPWAVLGLLSLRPATVASYDTTTGVLILLVGGAVSLLAYRVMLRIGRLPEEERVLR